MKINRFIALAAIALLVVGAMGFITARGLAYGSNSHLQQVVSTQAPDTDNVEEQVGDQSGADTGTTNSGVQVSAPGTIIAETSSVGEQTSAPTTIITDTDNGGDGEY